ncbi:NAD(P)-dependent dehydrogenase (short-subunit alcohol dehydrogenase family) [Rhizobium sp. BK226]|jgi:3-oxoacyl-[acyl-carrier protein] reductase|uniref:SDR family NAD(P)-dependent oxidoreductase n=1 Tax=Rhizobium TaxID=379 RepID=UPI0007B503C0|nr:MULTISPECIES: SDR family oxidoreductase [Rhizobium]KZS55060.1 epimerase [Rhizobium anhuiense bv. trifolii]MBB3301635.1 NAD(P)-dependent dehydrogenase (short-subunit alcohol dehydrogenase family) [Rhizobium sp. BK112]MBB3370895.1 NAD(P)-dependent dehydrogenase (short-subunit alcohol dehydrogenase family) [Rhizobium sp. BK077]MBB3746856.1 NAD(P)-dependent dehydrogenase (short-subunit alcohol dehydrogenase family) [Rhizobium sp. BK591]MBB4115417.1 NAD(P)-dependent dehydrogenase (short-subunit 
MSHVPPLAGQTILITGASGGIGAAIAERLSAEGARPVIQYGRDREGAEALHRRLGGDGLIVQADLSRPDGAFALWRDALAAAGRIHAVVNNAGIRNEISIDADPSDWRAAWQKEFQVNFFAAADLCKEALVHFRQHGGGRIVNMASRAGQRGYAADAMPYGATKAALINLTKSIARSFGRDGVVAVSIAPGWVRTDMAEDFVAKHGKDAAVGDIPIGEMAETAEIAELVAFLLRPSQVSVNGATFDVNGGSYIR